MTAYAICGFCYNEIHVRAKHPDHLEGQVEYRNNIALHPGCVDSFEKECEVCEECGEDFGKGYHAKSPDGKTCIECAMVREAEIQEMADEEARRERLSGSVA